MNIAFPINYFVLKFYPIFYKEGFVQSVQQA